MTERVDYRLEGRVATITMDDGKRNALNPKLLAALNEAIDQAERDEAAVILTGREGVFSAGFDLKVMKRGGVQALAMLKAGFTMTTRLLAYPYPVVAACNGHLMAMGVFLVLASDVRLGVTGDFKIAANEVAIGLPLPRTAEEMLRLRLTPSAFQRAAVLAETFNPEQALEAGFFDRLVTPEALHATARELVEQLLQLDPYAHTVTKRRVRAGTIRAIRRGIPLDLSDALVLGVRQVLTSRG